MAHRAGWKNAKHAQQWENSLAQHACPDIGPMLVQDVKLPQVLAVLEPLWVRGAIWAEFDLAAGVWTVQAAGMKAGKEHRVPRAHAARHQLAELPQGQPDEQVFKAARGGMLSDRTLTAVLRRLQVAAVPQGPRSTFRDWQAERTNYPRDVAEMVLARTIINKVETACRRGDLFQKRARMMADWAAFLACEQVPAGVVDLAFKRA